MLCSPVNLYTDLICALVKTSRLKQAYGLKPSQHLTSIHEGDSMRKVLLATSALVAFAGAAQAAESPITVNVGGYVDFRAGFFREASNNGTIAAATPAKRSDYDFDNEFRLNIEAVGKAGRGIEYGGLISLWNGAEYNDAFTGGQNNVRVNQAYVWLSGAYGKAVLGDDHGASDLFVYAPTVGEGQIDGTYTDFTDPRTLFVIQPTYIDNTENSTKVTYYTPKLGNENHKIQAGVSFAPNFYDNGQNVVKYNASGVTNGTGNASIQDYLEAAAQYTGQYGNIGTKLSATITTGDGQTNSVGLTRDFTSWGLGGQVMWNGATFGGSYVDAGTFGTVAGQNRQQDAWTVGAKYEIGKVAVAASFLDGQGYNNAFSVTSVGAGSVNYVNDQKVYGLGATYTWFPGLTTAADAVFVRQHRAGTVDGLEVGDNAANVFVVSQKITF